MNGSLSTAATAAAAAAGYALGAVTASGVNDYLGLAVAITGLFVGVARYGAVLQGLPRAKVERATGVGFFIGLAVSLAAVVYLAVL